MIDQNMAKRVVLVQREPILHYRVSVYNYFSRAFRNEGFDLTVVAETVQSDNLYPIEFDFVRATIAICGLRKMLDRLEPDAVIAFLRLRDWAIWPLLILGRLLGLPVLTWRHAVDLSQPRNFLKNRLYSLIDALAKGTVLYAAEEIRYVASRWHRKVFVANNTLNFDDFPRILQTKEQLRRSWNIPFAKIVLFSGRIQPRKRLDLLTDLFSRSEFADTGLVIVGPGMPDDLLERVQHVSNIRYLGPIYDPVKINELFKMADVFCIPGAMGLAINQAFYWGLPVVTQRAQHGPEICFLRSGANGYMTKSCEELSDALLSLVRDDELRKRFSEDARRTILSEGSIDQMAAGFVNAIKAAIS